MSIKQLLKGNANICMSSGLNCKDSLLSYIQVYARHVSSFLISNCPIFSSHQIIASNGKAGSSFCGSRSKFVPLIHVPSI